MSRIETIQQEVCNRYGISRADMLGPRRFSQFVKPRFIAMAIAQDLLVDQPYQVIGEMFGKRDHTTALSAIRRVNEWRRNADFDREYHEVRESISAMINPMFCHRGQAVFRSVRKGAVQ